MKIRVETTYTFVEEIFVDNVNFPGLTDDEAFDLEMSTPFSKIIEDVSILTPAPSRIVLTVHLIDDREIIVRSGTKVR